MIIKTISYSESRESVDHIGLKSWKKLGMEAEIEEGDILATSVAVLKEYVKGMILDEEEVQAAFNGRGWEQPPTMYPPQVLYNQSPTNAEPKIGITTEDINSCLEKKVLESYKYIIKGKPELESAYLEKMKEFI